MSNRRAPEEIEAFKKSVAKALGNSKTGKSMTELEEALAQSGADVDRAHLRRALLANGAEALGKTRASRWFSSAAIAKYGRDALNPQQAAAV